MKYDLEDRLIDFSILIIAIVNKIPNTLAGSYLAGQLVRSGISVMEPYTFQPVTLSSSKGQTGKRISFIISSLYFDKLSMTAFTVFYNFFLILLIRCSLFVIRYLKILRL